MITYGVWLFSCHLGGWLAGRPLFYCLYLKVIRLGLARLRLLLDGIVVVDTLMHPTERVANELRKAKIQTDRQLGIALL